MRHSRPSNTAPTFRSSTTREIYRLGARTVAWIVVLCCVAACVEFGSGNSSVVIVTPQNGATLVSVDGRTTFNVIVPPGVDADSIEVLANGKPVKGKWRTGQRHLRGEFRLPAGRSIVRLEISNGADIQTSRSIEVVVRTVEENETRLRQSNPDLLLEKGPDGMVHRLGGDNLAPVCSPMTRIDTEAAIDYVRCFLTANEALFAGASFLNENHTSKNLFGESLSSRSFSSRGFGGTPRPQPISAIRITQVSEDGPGRGTIRFRQFAGDLPILESSMTLSVKNGQVTFATGSLIPGNKVPVVNRGHGLDEDRARVLARVREAAGTDVVETARSFSIRYGRAFSEFLRTSDRARAYIYDEKKGAVVKSYLAASGERLFEQWEVPHIPGARAPDDAGRARVYYSMNDLQRCLEWLVMCGTSPVVENLVTFEANSPCRPDNTYPGFPNNHAFDFRGGATIRHFVFDLDCTPGGTGIETPQLVFDSSEVGIGNAAFWLEDLAAFANHPEAELNGTIPWADYAPRALQVTVYGTIADVGHAAMAVPGAISFHDGQFGPATDIYLPQYSDQLANAATSLGTIAHEYGHHVAYSYSFATILGGGYTITEGWGIHNALRYGLWRARLRSEPSRSHDPIVGDLGYNMFVMESGVRHSQSWSNGELLPGNRRVGRGAGNDVLFADANCQHGAYECSTPMNAVYWELVWNLNRTSYHGLPFNEPIFIDATCTGGSEVPDLFPSINRAYTRALMVHPNHTGLDAFDSLNHVDAFMDAVHAELYTEIDGAPCFFSEEDLYRVAKVMGHHCVGPLSDLCAENEFATLPGSPLPLTDTTQSRFDLNPTQYLLPAASMLATYGASSESYSLTPNSGEVIPLQSNGGKAEFYVQLPEAGCYRARVAARANPGTEGTLTIGDETNDIAWTSPPSITAWSNDVLLQEQTPRWAPVAIEVTEGQAGIVAFAMDYDGLQGDCWQHGPDLVLRSLSGTNQGTAGDPLALSDTVVNIGTEGSPAVTVTYHLSTDQEITTDDWFLGSRQVPELDPPANFPGDGGSSSLATTVSIPWSVPPGEYWLGAVVDHYNDAIESNENNNTNWGNRVTVTGQGDLVVSSVAASKSPRGILGAQFEISNTGNVDIGLLTPVMPTVAFRVSLAIDPDNGPARVIETYDVQNVPAGGSISLSEPVVLIPIEFGIEPPYRLKVDVDYANEVSESNEFNNTGYSAVIE